MINNYVVDDCTARLCGLELLCYIAGSIITLVGRLQ